MNSEILLNKYYRPESERNSWFVLIFLFEEELCYGLCSDVPSEAHVVIGAFSVVTGSTVCDARIKGV